MNKFIIFLMFHSVVALSQETLETIEVVEKKSFSEFWEENKEAAIFSGKKNTLTDLKMIPQVQTNNYRQATGQTPGLLISEIPNESLAAMTYRGLGDPHESYNLLLLQDGLPVAADMYGYPAHYFSPALPMMEKFQFIRGGAGLLYGPQPAGVINYVSTPILKNQPLSGRVRVTGGSYNLLTTNNSIFGSSGDNAYAVEYHRRQGDGPQRVNSDFTADYVQIRNKIFKDKNTYNIAFNGYNSDHGETGGFAKKSDVNTNVFGDDLGKASKKYDRLKVSRAQLALGVERKIDDSSKMHVNVWANAYRRYSKRQNGSNFGTFADGNTNSIATQNYYGYNGEIRYLRNYKAFQNEHTLTAGFLNYNLMAPIVTETGASEDSNHGAIDRRVDRNTRANSIFVENRFSFGNLMVTPGVRMESINQSIDERVGPSATLRKADDTVNQPLFGLGLAYHTTDESQLYANISESYKPVTFAETVPLNASTTVSEDIDPSKLITYEAGFRGQSDLLNWDASAYFIRYENKFGQIGTGTGINFQNTGAGTNKGIDLAGELKLSKVFSKLAPTGDFNLYANLAILDARFTRGELKDKAPQYAPKTITRVGLIFNKEEKLKIAFMGNMVSSHFANDNNTDDFEIPYYSVFDLTADWSINKNWSTSFGINNIFNREYYSRVRADGIIWALDRNLYAGMTYKF